MNLNQEAKTEIIYLIKGEEKKKKKKEKKKKKKGKINGS